MPADSIWLIQAAEHFFQGRALSEYYFDTNPPMCFLIYLPVVFLSYTGLALWDALNLYSLGLVICAVLAMSYTMAKWHVSVLTKQAALLGFILAVTIIPFQEFGQKDHLIAIGIVPFLLAQLSLTFQHKQSRSALIIILICFVPFVLIKPHYGLLCCALIAHRLYRSRDYRALIQPDVIVLTLATSAYALITILAFPDFLEIVLPLSMKLYVSQTGVNFKAMHVIAPLIFTACLGVYGFLVAKTQEEKKLVLLFGILAALAIIPYAVQGKGFSLHFIPFMTLTTILTAITLSMSCPKQYRQKVKFIVTALLVLAGFALIPLKPPEDLSHPHSKYTDLLNRLEISPDAHSFYIESNSTNVIFPIAVYNNMRHASRFSANWFTPHLDMLAGAERRYYKDYLGNALAEDISRYQPDNLVYIKNDKANNILGTFQDHAGFQQALSGYKEIKTIDTNQIFFQGRYKPDTPDLRYVIYKRKNL